MRQSLLGYYLVDIFTYHRMLTGTDKIEVLALDLVHHGIHLCKAHNAGNNFASDHERRYTVSKTSVDHKIPGVRNNCRMKSCDVTHQVIETVTCNTSCSIKVYTMEFFHDLCMIRDLKIRYLGLTKTLNLNVFAVILTYRNRRIDDVRDDHHSLLNLFLKLSLLFIKSCQFISKLGNLFLSLFSLSLLALSH